MYSRNWTVEQGKELCFGRVRVALRKPDGSPVNPEVPTRELFWQEIAGQLGGSGRMGVWVGLPVGATCELFGGKLPGSWVGERRGG